MGDPRHGQQHTLFAEGCAVTSLDRGTGRWPPGHLAVHCSSRCVTGWCPKITQPLCIVTSDYSGSHLSASLCDHWQCSGSTPMQTVVPSSEHWSRKMLQWSDRSWQTLAQKGNQQLRSWVPLESSHHLLTVYNHRKTLLFTICRPVLIEIALGMT